MIDYSNKILTTINKDTLSNAKEIFEQQNYSDQKFDLQGPIKSCTISTNGYNAKIEINNDHIFNSKCQCLIGKNGIICKHAVAALLVLIDHLENNDSFNITKDLNYYTNDLEIINILNYVFKNDILLKISLNSNSLFLDFPSELQNVNDYKQDLINITNELYKNNKNKYKSLLEKLNKLVVIANYYKKYENKINNNINYSDFDDLMNNISEISAIKINHGMFETNLEISFDPTNTIDVNLFSTSIGFVIKSCIVDGVYLNINDYMYYILKVDANKIKWLKIKWDDVENPNLIFKLNRTINDISQMYDKLQEMKRCKSFNFNIIKNNVSLKLMPILKFEYDKENSICCLTIINNKNIIKKYFSKFVNSFKEVNKDEFIYKTNNLDDISDILSQIKKIKKQESIKVVIDPKILNKKRHKLSINFKMEKEWLVLKVSGNINQKILDKVYEAYLKNKKFVTIDNKVYDTDEYDFKEIEKELKLLMISNNSKSLELKLNKNETFYLSSKFNENESMQRILKKINEDENKNFLEHIEHSILKPYQVYGVNWMIRMFNFTNGCILADEMGLGKTIQTIFLLKYLYTRSELPTLIILPSTLVFNWKNELDKFAPELEYEIISGSAKARKEQIENIKRNKIYITTYNLINYDIKNLLEHKFYNVILDEGQNIKNCDSTWTQKIKLLDTKNRLILSGTPIENNLSELWSLFEFILPGYLGDLKTFKQIYMSSVNEEETKKHLLELSLMVKPYILQRRKIDYIDLPNKEIKNIYVDMTENEKQHYDALLKVINEKIYSDLKNNKTKNKIEILSMITKLRQYCCDPKLLGFNDLKSSKINRCLELVQEIIKKDNNSKIVLFSNFKSALNNINEVFKNQGIKSLIITGDNQNDEREQIINDFKNGDYQVLLISLKVGGVGLNLNFANNVIIFNPWWNESAELQAMDRLHRIGQEQIVNVYRLIYNNTIEENIEKLKESKVNIINMTLNSLKYEDILSILGK